MRKYTLAGLGKTQLRRLREDIVLNSLFLRDYENRYGIDVHEVSNFFDGYVDHLTILMEEDHGARETDMNFFELLPDYDNINTLLAWHDLYRSF